MSSSPSTAEVDVAGLAVRIEAETPGDLDLIRRVTGDRPVSGPADVVLRLGRDVPPGPADPPDFRGPYGDHWDDGRRHHFEHHWGLSASVDAQGAELGGPVEGHRRWVAVRNALLFVLARLFLERDRFVLHAAGLRRDDVGVLVVGDSGAGKSTLAFAAGRAGWGVLGDDMVVVDRVGGTVVARGVPRAPSVPGDAAAAAGVRGESLPGDDRGRVELVDARLDPDAAAVRCVLVTAHGTGHGTVEQLDAATALHQLAPAFVLSELPGPLRRWFPIAAALARGPRARLHQAASAAERVDGAGGLLDAAIELAHGGAVHPNLPDTTSSR